MECNDNEFCKNLDLYKSSPGKIVYRCPTSTCSAGTCNCASPCFRDFTTGTCVRPMDTIPPFIPPGTLPPPITNRPVRGPVSMPTQAPLPGVSKPPTGVCLRTTIGNNVCWRIDGRNIVNCDCKDVRSSIVYNVSSFNSDVKQLAPSEIAGIVIGSLAGFAILVFLILLLKKNSKVPKP